MSAEPTTRERLRLRQASADNWALLEHFKDPELRRQFIEDLREHEWTIFTPRGVDFVRFHELVERDPALREYVESEVDPRVVSEYLLRAYPSVFFTIDHVFQIFTDWKCRRVKQRGHQGHLPQERPPVPPGIVDALAESELTIMARYEIRHVMKELNRDPQQAIADLERRAEQDPYKKRSFLYRQLGQRMQELVDRRYPKFHTHLRGSPRPFPSMHVRWWLDQIAARPNSLLVGDVGTQKTSAAVIGLEQHGAKATVVFCHSYAREMWAKEIKDYYIEEMDPYIVKGTEDIKHLEALKPEDLRRHRFFIVGYGNIQFGGEQDELGSKFGDRLIEALCKLNPDSIIIDEAHAIKNDSDRSGRVMRLAQTASVKYRLMLTATPFENNPNEMARLAVLLDSEMFPSEEVFHAMCRDNPRIFFGLTTKLMCDYFAQRDVLDLPPTNLAANGFIPAIELVAEKNFHELHDAIMDDGSISSWEQVSRVTRFLAIPWIAKRWYPEAKKVPCVLDPLAHPKIAYLKERIATLITDGKVVIGSGIYADGVTRTSAPAIDGMEEHEIANLMEAWFPGKVLRLDGTATKSYREWAQNQWRNNPECRIFVVSVTAAAESLNFTLARVPGVVERLTIYYITLPWKPTIVLQFNGRYGRPGSEVPMNVFHLLIKGTADEALAELNERKWRNFLIGVYGIPILTIEEQALERATFQKMTMTPSRWLRRAFGDMLGMGEEGIETYLGQTIEGLPIGETIAQYYLQMEDRGPSGHISRVLAPTIKRWHDKGVLPDWNEVLDVGPGVLGLERKLSAPIFAIEINPRMLEMGRSHSSQGGRNAIVGRASSMPAEWTGKFSLVVVSLMLHLTSRKTKKGKQLIERVRVLQECHRAMKQDGYLWLTILDNYFDEDSFQNFVEALRCYGFEAVSPWCNRIKAVDHLQHPFAFWSILVRKEGELSDTALPCPLFLHELEHAALVRKKGPKRAQPDVVAEPNLIQHEKFVICDGASERPIEDVADVIQPKDDRWQRLSQVLVDRFHLTGTSLADELSAQVTRTKPQSKTELKEIWKRIRALPDAPKINWSELNRVAGEFLRVS